MVARDVARVRNIGIIAHIDAGKTTTTERILYYTGESHKMGDVDDGTTVTDYRPDEQQRGITITAAAITCHWQDCTIHLIDTPGHVDFTAEVERSLRVLDGGVVVFSAVEGVEAQSETVWRQADKYHVPRLCFINKIDRLGADPQAAVDDIRHRLQARPLPLQMPVAIPDALPGLIDLVRLRLYRFDSASLGQIVIEEPIPEALMDEARARREAMIEALAEHDDELLERFLEGADLPEALLRRAIRRGTLSARLQPVLFGSALRYVGVQPVLDAICWYLPSPLDRPPVEGKHPKRDRVERRSASAEEPFCGLAFKITADAHGELVFVRVYSGVLKPGTRVLNATRDQKEIVTQLWHIQANRRERIDAVQAGDIVGLVGLKSVRTGDTLCDPRHPIVLESIEFPQTVVRMAIEPDSADDRVKLSHTLELLAREDPTFQWRVDAESGQTLISGMGELHLEILRDRMLREFHVNARIGKPRVNYRETIRQTVEAEGAFALPAAGHGQEGRVRLRFEPLPGESSIAFENRLRSPGLPKSFVAAIEQALRDEASTGIVFGYPLINLKAILLEASYQEADSSEAAYQFAASEAMRKGIPQADPVLLEPLMRLEITTPEDYVGAFVADLQARGAEILAMHVRGRHRVLTAEAPLRRMFGYATVARGLSQGRASYTMEFRRYAPAPPDVVERLLG